MTFDIAGLWGLVLLASPIVVLLLSAWAYAAAEAMARSRPAAATSPREPADAPQPDAIPAARRQPDTPAAASASARAAPASAPASKSAPAPRLVPTPPTPADQHNRIPVSEARAVPPLPELPRPAFPKPPPSAGAVEKSLAEAEAAGKTELIPELKVALGMARFREGLIAAQAANDVRNGLIMAMQSGHKLAQARARVALGDLCKASDDLTTACEHWQIARDLFRELGTPGERKDAETRIRANGCPTDWVLNEF